MLLIQFGWIYFQGPKGTKGDTGGSGPVGPVGPQGPQGPPGPVQRVDGGEAVLAGEKVICNMV